METASSPTGKETTQTENLKEIGFPKAMDEISKGKKVHKLEWKDKAFYGHLNGEHLSLHKPDGKNYQWIISDGDMAGTDYIVL